jgi:hypothetical protein
MLRYSINQLFPSVYLRNNISRPTNYVLSSAPIITTNYYSHHPITHAIAPIIANSNRNFYSMPINTYNLNSHPCYPIYISTAPNAVYQSNIYQPPLMTMTAGNIYYPPLTRVNSFSHYLQPNFPSAPAVLASQMPNPPTFPNVNPSLRMPIQTHAQTQTQTQTQITTQSEKIDVGTQTDNPFEKQINQRMSGEVAGSIPLPTIAIALLKANKKTADDSKLSQAERYRYC